MIYTSITDNKDAPRDDIKCFSEYNKFKDPVLNAKIYKVLPHLFMDTEWSLWVDGTVTIKNLDEFLKECEGHDLVVFKHPNRNCLFDEAEEVIRLGLDSEDIVRSQILRYKAFPRQKGLGACYIIFRRHTEQIKSLCEKWWAEITRGSRRDQISFPYVFHEVVHYLDWQPTNDNKYFTRRGHLK